MDVSEATAILGKRLAHYREYPYTHLARLVGSDKFEQQHGVSGVLYQLEFNFLWDGPHGGDVRVIGSIDDGGIRSFLPLCDDFAMSPDGSLVGE